MCGFLVEEIRSNPVGLTVRQSNKQTRTHMSGLGVLPGISIFGRRVIGLLFRPQDEVATLDGPRIYRLALSPRLTVPPSHK